MHSPCFSPLPSFLITSQSFRLVRSLAGTLPTEAGVFHTLHMAPVASADSPVASGHSTEGALGDSPLQQELLGSPCCTLVRNSISNGKITLDYTKGYFVRGDNMVHAGEI